MELQDLQVDPIEGTEIMSYLGVHPSDIHDPHKFSRLKDVINFFQGAEDKRFIISKLLTGKAGLDPIDHIWGYVTLRKEHQVKQKEMEQLTQELSFYER